VNEEEKSYVRSLVRRFWGEEQQLTFDRKFDVAELPVFIAKVKSKIAGFISFSSTGDTLVIVALGIIPMYQNRGIGSGLIQKVETEARRLKTKRILVSTSNDDLPALGFYQSHGFQVYDVKPNAIAEKHGKVSRGLGGLPVRDELRLQKMLD
jgi:ribosomal protein S18 acetylase RimI-like enzyme